MSNKGTMRPDTILWIYIALLILGGLMGFIKARSKASIIASMAFAIPLALVAAGILGPTWIADVILAILILFFGMRFLKTKKFMPAGLMSILSIATIAARFLLR
ncbi:MAG: TMEM14 family protein [Limisphaerales bacterium]